LLGLEKGEGFFGLELTWPRSNQNETGFGVFVDIKAQAALID
jgi:hypothetical protein